MYFLMILMNPSIKSLKKLIKGQNRPFHFMDTTKKINGANLFFTLLGKSGIIEFEF